MLRKKTAASIVEYMALVIIVIGGMIVISPYVIRAFGGSWKKSGDAFGMGRRYNGNTVECDYSQLDANNGIWYDATCYQGKVQSCTPGNYACEDDVKTECQTAFCSNR